VKRVSFTQEGADRSLCGELSRTQDGSLKIAVGAEGQSETESLIDETLKPAAETCAQAAATVRESQRLGRIHRERLSHDRHDVGH
jgi:hypothetical protein